MNRLDFVLLWVIAVLGLGAAILRIVLAGRRNKPLSTAWKLQGFVFPALLLAALALYGFGVDLVFPLMLMALAEELICGFFRRRGERADHTGKDA